MSGAGGCAAWWDAAAEEFARLGRAPAPRPPRSPAEAPAPLASWALVPSKALRQAAALGRLQGRHGDAAPQMEASLCMLIEAACADGYRGDKAGLWTTLAFAWRDAERATVAARRKASWTIPYVVRPLIERLAPLREVMAAAAAENDLQGHGTGRAPMTPREVRALVAGAIAGAASYRRARRYG